MRKKFFSLLILLALILCGCNNDIVSESLKENNSQTSFEDSSEFSSTQKTYSYSTIYGEYNDDMLINESEFETILYKCYGNSYKIFEQKSEVKYKEVSFIVSGEFLGSVEIYDSIADAKIAYKNWFILTEGKTKPLQVFLYLDNVVRIGNAIIVGEEKAIKPICNYYNISVETKVGVKKTESINHKMRYSVEEIESFMLGKGYIQYDSQVNEGLTQYKTFINFEKSDIGVIIVCETAEKTKNLAEDLYNEFEAQYSCLYSNNYIFLSRGELWENIFNEMNQETGDGSKSLKKVSF